MKLIEDVSIFDYSKETIEKRLNNNQQLITELKETYHQLKELKKSFDNYPRKDILQLLTGNVKNQNSISSNMIEKIVSSVTKLHRLATAQDKTGSHSEEKVFHYYQAIQDIINENPPISIENIEKYHNYFETKSWKIKENWIKNTATNEIIFEPASYQASKFYTSLIIESFNKYKDADDDLFLARVICFNLDFLSIHPFSDGNGRMSRILMNWMMYNDAPTKFISLDSLILAYLPQYYNALIQCNKTWYEKNQAYFNDYAEYILYALSGFIALGKRFLNSNIWEIDGTKEIYEAIINLEDDEFDVEDLLQNEKLSLYKDNIEEVLIEFEKLWLIGKGLQKQYNKFALKRVKG